MLVIEIKDDKGCVWYWCGTRFELTPRIINAASYPGIQTMRKKAHGYCERIRNQTPCFIHGTDEQMRIMPVSVNLRMKLHTLIKMVDGMMVPISTYESLPDCMLSVKVKDDYWSIVTAGDKFIYFGQNKNVDYYIIPTIKED